MTYMGMDRDMEMDMGMDMEMEMGHGHAMATACNPPHATHRMQPLHSSSRPYGQGTSWLMYFLSSPASVAGSSGFAAKSEKPISEHLVRVG